MQDKAFISAENLRRRSGVELVGTAGIETPWSMPVALWDAPNGFDTRDQPDHQPCHVIALRLSGGSVQRVGSECARSERLPTDGFSVHPASTDLRFIAPSKIRFAHIYVSDEFFEQTFRTLRDSELGASRFVSDERVMYQDTSLGGQLVEYVARAFDTLDPPVALEMESRANLIAIQFLNRHSLRAQLAPRPDECGKLADWQVARACQFMESNLARRVSLAEISYLVRLSPEHFCRAFHRTTGLPPHRWMAAKRMDRAREYLVKLDASLTTIAQELGYAGQSAFGAAFRRENGMSPSDFRRAHWSGTETAIAGCASLLATGLE